MTFTHRMSTPTIKLTALLSALILCIFALSYLYIQASVSAFWLLFTLILVTIISAIFNLFKQQQKQLTSVINALANGDSTLGLSHDHPLRQQIERVKTQMQSARYSAQQQAQFLQTLLVHIDLAVLVCDAQGKVIESNPAVAKLLGTPVRHLSDIEPIGALILATDTHLRSCAQWQRGEQQDTLSIQVSVTQIQGQLTRIVTLQSIHGALLSKEQQAYKRLTQVLTHEVANSITPLASIANTCTNLLPNSLTFNDEEDKDDLRLALNTLASRTKHLGEFIDNFRQVSALPSPNLALNDLGLVLEQSLLLHQSQLSLAQIQFELHIKTAQNALIDKGQIEQVLINLLKNAIEAVNSTSHENTLTVPMITLTLGQNETQQVFIEIANTGPSIPDHVIDMIFVPFFTTKQHGSGIGLSLSRQIMINHGGELVYVKRATGACFRCIFG